MLEAFEKVPAANSQIDDTAVKDTVIKETVIKETVIKETVIKDTAVKLEVVLTFEERKKSRYKTQTVCGKALGWFLERGQVLADGQCLRCSDGSLVKIVAAAELVSDVTSANSLALTRAAYHLGNRHVPLQIGDGFLRYQHDHVLDEMVRGLGLKVVEQHQPFQPESGAYHKHALNSSGDRDHQAHNHEHPHNH